MRLHARGIGHRYGDLDALSSVDLDVEDGEIVVLIGPSGCGKSTLLSILGGILAPSAGAVSVSGRAPAGCLNPLTFVFQDFALLPWQTVAGNLAIVLAHHRIDRAERARRIDDALRLTGLAEFKDAFPRQLSGGMRQRVGIARALVVAPAVLLMDEPLSALDAQTRTLLLEELLAIWDRARTTTVYVTHNLDEAVRIADRIVVLSRRPGRIKEIVPVDLPRAVRADPGHATRVAALHETLWTLIRGEAAVADREIRDD